MTGSPRLSADDFFTGLFAALALEGRSAISIRTDTFDRIVADVFAQARTEGEAKGLEFKFRIRRHPVHGDSLTVKDAISAAVQRDLVSLDNPEYQDIRFKFGPETAEVLLNRLPADRDFFVSLAQGFLREYDSVETGAPTAA